METLIKIDPEKHMYRWYSVGIQSTLVDGIAVVYGWGSLKSSFQQWRTIKVESKEEAEKYAKKMVANKLANGYQREYKDFLTENVSCIESVRKFERTLSILHLGLQQRWI